MAGESCNYSTMHMCKTGEKRGQTLVTWQASTAGPLGGVPIADFSLPTQRSELSLTGALFRLSWASADLSCVRVSLAKPLDTMLRRATLHDDAGSHCKAFGRGDDHHWCPGQFTCCRLLRAAVEEETCDCRQGVRRSFRWRAASPAASDIDILALPNRRDHHARNWSGSKSCRVAALEAVHSVTEYVK